MTTNLLQRQVDESESIHPPVENITDLLTFRLARLVAVNDRAGNHWISRTFNLRLNEWRVLGLTRALEPVRFHEIANRLMMDKGQLSRIVKAMVKRELITASPAKEDARTFELRTSPTGRALHDEVLPFTTKRNEVAVGSLTPQECAQFMHLLEKISGLNEALLEESDQIR